MYVKKAIFSLLFFVQVTCFAQVFIDSCFSSIPISKNFTDPDLKLKGSQIKGKNFGMAYWNDSVWISSHSKLRLDFLDAHPLNATAPNNNLGFRILYLGYALDDGGDWDKELTPEFIAFKISGKFIQGENYSFNFIYLTNGWDNNQKITGFAPLIFTNSKPSLDGRHYCGRLPEAGPDWQLGSISFSASKEQLEDCWIILHPGYGDPAGMLLSPCAFPYVRMNSVYYNSDPSNSSDFSDLINTGKITLKNINFTTDDYHIPNDAFTQLDSLALFLKQHSEIKIIIVGYTDNVGDEHENQKLSELRAKSVYEYLIQKGVTMSLLSYIGRGENGAVAPNDTPLNRLKNRRVELEVIR